MTIGMEDLYPGQDVECSRVFAANTSYPRHTHEEYIVSANLKGTEYVWVDNKKHVVSAGQVTIYNPMAIQSSEFSSDGVDFISLHVNPNSLIDVFKENNLPSGYFYPTLRQGSFNDDQLYKAIIDCYMAARETDDYKEEAILWLLSTLLDVDSASDTNRKKYIKNAISSMKDCLDHKLDLSSLASSVGLSKYHFVRAFKQEIGIAPIQYHMQLRLIEARKRLKSGVRPIDVMVDLGFYDQSHFINTFRKIMAITPNQYSKKVFSGHFKNSK
ncbi:AraC family transcriptional regulator [Halopseudomonas pelagia]|uniref:AraC family transcriptional regulator n=1 Tax=Halopseudomonas pelagia TaxID=553151 RepID=A0AA91U5C0_9GAMM|nr:AraC family transcriptional regulator [Halopseudomonas pelagia]PCD01094.1 AraC family transcriptional regulator [Halopseudomonas pelagia]QFY56450.1 AraC family transcriptional regulator [Halopseudomonas pelagia]